MKHYNKEIGNLGEEIAKKELLKLSYKILEENYSCKIGEIDIICLHNKCLIFVEVKTRYNNKYGYPCEAVTFHKRKKISKTAEYYIMNNRIKNINVRFDVIEIILNFNNTLYTINHICDAFRL